MPQIIIDTKTIDFAPGESVIAVAKKHHIDIPHYCWHSRLSIAANCRMCLVDVEKAPKLMPACQTECKDGMVVHTQNDRVKAAQRAVHEFLLLNHPIDCPICDQAGECKLQNYYMKYQLAPSRMHDMKVRKRKLNKLGPYVIYDAERCIVCTRCVRFMDEVVHDRQLGVFNRGDHSVIGTFPNQPLDNPYSLNTVDICPVGALTSNIFRFKQRVWNLQRSKSICPGCARGCNIHVDSRSAQVYRFVPRENNAVNQLWMCDEGRLTYQQPNIDKLNYALIKAHGTVLHTDSTKAIAQATDVLQTAVHKQKKISLVLSCYATCEAAYMLGLMARDIFNIQTLVLLGYPLGTGDDMLRVADKNPNRAGITWVCETLGLAVQHTIPHDAEVVLLVGHEFAGVDNVVQTWQQQAQLVHIAHARSALCDIADVTLPGASWVEAIGTWINIDRIKQQLDMAFAPQGDAKPQTFWLQTLATALGQPIDTTAIEQHIGGAL